MRNFKRTLALVLAVLVVVGTFATVSAAETPWYQPGVDYIQGIGVDTITPAKAQQKITRNDFILWVAKIESHQLSENAWKDEIAGVSFTDVNDSHHKAAIAYSKQANFIVGNGDGTFSPDKATTLGEASAVIVRMMGYEDKVYDKSSENWAYNYMRAAQTYCYAFDNIFLANTDTYNPYFELTYGQAAYLLASIMNYSAIDKELSLTADGIDLGAYFQVNTNLGVTENTYYVVSMERLVETIGRGGNFSALNIATNLLDTTKEVVLAPVNGGQVITIAGEEFLRQVRLALGLPEYVDFMNEADEISVFENVQVGSLVTIKTDRQTGKILDFDITVGDTNSVVVNTYVQATALTSTTVPNFSNKYLGWHAASIGSNNFIPVLPTSYNETLVTEWTNVVKNADGVITSAVLNFQGKKYNVGTKSDIEIYMADSFDVVTGKYVALTADEAVKTLINAAQGSVYAVFNDTDNDGDFDTVIVHKSDAFKIFSGVNNVDGSKDDVYYPYITALTNGETVKDAAGNEITETPKFSAIGTVLFNHSIKFPNGTALTTAWTNLCSDAWTNVGEATGKLQLAIAAEDGMGVLGGANNGGNAAQPMIHPIYKVVDLAAFESGIIEEIDAFTLEDLGYFVAKIRTAAGEVKTVYIPDAEHISTKATFDVTIGGATAEYTLDSSAWCTFLNEATEAAAKELGIVSGVTNDEHRAATAAWMAGKWVNFATDAEGVAICLLGTDKSTGVNGFVVSADKTATGENTYNVTIAQSGSNKDAVDVYLTEILASHFGYTATPASHIHGYERPGQSGGFSNMFTEDANKPGTYLPKGGKFVTIDGVAYPVDTQGNLFICERTYSTNSGVNGVVTKEVRASASAMFDWANYEVYNAIFAGSLIDPNFKADGIVNPGTDLIYVNLMQDAGSYYLQYKPYDASFVAQTTGNEYFAINGNTSTFRNRWYYPITTLASFTAENSWHNMEGGHIIGIVENEVLAEGLQSNNLVKFEAKYAAVVGYEPYFVRTYNVKAEVYEYVIKYARVEILKDVIGTAEGIVDTKNTYMVPLYYGETGKDSVQVTAVTAEQKAQYTLENGFFVDDNNLVFIIISDIGIKWETIKDANGKDQYKYTDVKYDWANATVLVTLTDVELNKVAAAVETAIAALDVNNDADDTNDFAIAKVANVDSTYATVKFINKVNGDAGYYPGAAYAVIDTEGASYKYTVTSKTPVVLVTPSASGFQTTVYTVGELVNSKTEFFATQWNATVKAGSDIFGLALLGMNTGVDISEDVPTEEKPEVKPSENILVYLNKSAKAVVRANQYGAGWMVISDESAIAIPSGESVGQIYRVYSTYAEAKKAASIDLTIEGGSYYMVDKNLAIVDNYVVEVKTGKLVSENIAGKTMADMGDGKVVDVSGYDFEWFYRNVEGDLCVAGDSTNVSIIDSKAYAGLFKSLEDKVASTKTTLEVKEAAYLAGKLSQTKYDYYKAEYEAAVAALDAAKLSNIDKYFNGQFWGFANSPYYTYVAMGAGSFQQDVSYLWFDYIEVNGVYCVFSDTFSVTDPNA